MHINDLSQALAKRFSLNLSRAKCMAQIINGVMHARHIHLHLIGEHFSSNNPDSARRRIQRFLQDIRLDNKLCAQFIAALLPDGLEGFGSFGD